MNSTVVTGNIVRGPELRSTASGNAVASFSVADNRRFTDATGERREATSYMDVVAWGDLGRHVAESLRQGDRVTVTGHLEQRSWETAEGERRSKLELNATDVAASLRFATLAVLKPERGAELSEDQGYDLGADEQAAPGPGLLVWPQVVALVLGELGAALGLQHGEGREAEARGHVGGVQL